ncbi:DUF2507 domain-containing protein [Lentibacillus cibarius]|uniref:DUF2507 domain-containing protein n=1 Tax=Lentibacillus cibarius TaxID=2583219 RepID=UPI002279CA50|nr:DUF2507 domain-containing protein [Lentibacillus cibarius]
MPGSYKYSLFPISNIKFAFKQLGWGYLDLVKEKKNELTFQLMADAVVYRLNAPIETEFRLEAGFLSESVSLVKQRPCECKEKIQNKIHQIEFSAIFTD